MDEVKPITTAERMLHELQKWASAQEPVVVGVIAVHEAITDSEGEMNHASLFVGPGLISPKDLRILGQMFLVEAERLAERVESDTTPPPGTRLH